MKQHSTKWMALLAMAALALGSLSVAFATDSVSQIDSINEAANLTFTGEGDNGNFQTALDDAIWQAQQYYIEMGYADYLVEYRVRNATGLAGGFAGFQIIRVTIVLPNTGTDPSDRYQ